MPRMRYVDRLLDRFVGMASGGWPADSVRALHPSDYARFVGIVAYAHARRVALSPEGLRTQLSGRGMRDELIETLVDRYRFGRVLLARHPHPWNRRQSREERRRDAFSFQESALARLEDGASAPLASGGATNERR